MSDVRNWKWMLPGAGFALALLLTRYFTLSQYEWVRSYAIVTWIIALLCGIASIGNYVDYRHDKSMSIFERKQSAISRTQLSVELEMSRGVSPDVAKILINERRRVWMMKSGVKVDGIAPHSVLYGAPDVTEYFLEYFLKSSTDKSVMPKRLLSDKRKNRFDPWGVVSEYTMYDHLIELLKVQGKVQRWSEFDIYEWVFPWTPELIAEDYDRAWWFEEEQVSEVSEVSKVAEVQRSKGAEVVPKVEPVRTEDVLTDAEAEKIRKIEEEHTKRWQMTVSEFVELNQKNKKEKNTA